MKYYNVGLIGAGFMAKAHSIAYAGMPMFFWPAPGIPVKKVIADLTEESAKDAALRLGFERSTSKWQEIIEDSSIDIVDICTPNDSQKKIAVAAANAGKHVFCEKPIARNAEEAKVMMDAVKKAGVKHMLAFNYRRTPLSLWPKNILWKAQSAKF